MNMGVLLNSAYLLLQMLLSEYAVESARSSRSSRSYRSYYSRYYSRYYSYYSYYYNTYASSGSAGVVAGAVIGGIVGVMIIVAIILIIRHRIKNMPRRPLFLTRSSPKTSISITSSSACPPAKQTIPPPQNNINYTPNLPPPSYASTDPAYPPPASSYGYF